MASCNKNVCAYCGVKLTDKNKTRDHIPPKCFFTKEERKKIQLITIPSCKNCNNKCNTQDENTRFVLNLCVEQMERSKKEKMEQLKKNLQKNKRLRRLFDCSTSILEKDTKTGTYTLKNLIKIDVKYIADTKKVLCRIARGLFWYHYKRRLDAGTYDISFLAGWDLKRSSEMTQEEISQKKEVMLSLMKACKIKVVLSDVFTYWIGKVPDHEYASIFFMLYENTVLVCIIALPKKT